MLSFAAASPRIKRLIQLCISAVILYGLTWTFLSQTTVGNSIQSQIPPIPMFTAPELPLQPHHPIDDLIYKANHEFGDLLAKETHNVQSAEYAYQVRRGRRPPPGFDAWYTFAQEREAIIVEDFFDRIYDDLNPFWARPAELMRQQASQWFYRISVRNGNVTTHGDGVDRPWLNLWADMIGTISEFLPDLDVPINEMDESRIIVPWEEIHEYVSLESMTRSLVPAADAVLDYNVTVVQNEEDLIPYDFAFQFHGPYWEHAVLGCDPNSAARTEFRPEYNYSITPPLPTSRPDHSYEGYVRNWTLTKSPCDNPELQGLHGTFVEPLSLANSRRFFPMFGGSKLPMNNEILLPPAMYWTDDPFYSGGDWHGSDWEEKKDKVIWRGAASGGRNREENWTRFQRHRFVAMMNGTTIRESESSGISPPNFAIPEFSAYHLQAVRTGNLGHWTSSIADAEFVHLLCFPDPDPPSCSYTDPWFSVGEQTPMKEQYTYKYLPDIDGNSFSGRYRGFLGSTSLPIKATIYDEWHDSRLQPWKHFVPMDNTFVDIYGILAYFLGDDKYRGHDEVAKAIALEGQDWAQRVLRREDMQIYVYRLLLEYARLCDDNRENLAWMT